MLIASMNPCPCGYFGSKDKECSCSPTAIERYINKISGPLLDRFDIHIEVPQVKYDKLSAHTKCETSSEVKLRVDNARNIQLKRYSSHNIFSNSELTKTAFIASCFLSSFAAEIIGSVIKLRAERPNATKRQIIKSLIPGINTFSSFFIISPPMHHIF